MADTNSTRTPLAASAANLDAKARTSSSSSFARRIPLPMLSRALAERTGRPPPSYRRCYVAALDGALPALQHGGRWFVADEDLDAAAVALGMVERSEPAPERPAEACGRVGSDHDGGRMAARTARKVMERRGGGA